jgi:hypothetical protein
VIPLPLVLKLAGSAMSDPEDYVLIADAGKFEAPRTDAPVEPKEQEDGDIQQVQ